MFESIKNMSIAQKIWASIGILVGLMVIAGMIGAAADGSLSAQAAPVATATTKVPTKQPFPTEAPRKPITVLHYDGTSNHTTDNFQIFSPTWTITWKCQGSNFDGVLYINLYSSDGTLVSAPVSTECKGQQTTDTTTIHSPGRFYLEVLSANATYSITVVDPNQPLG